MATTRGKAPRRTFQSLRTRRDFDRVFERGRRIRLGPLTLVIRRDRHSTPTHSREAAPTPTVDEPERASPGRFAVGFKIGKRVGKAVRRNRVRRRLKALLERYDLPEGKTFEMVLILHPSSADLDFRELEERLAPVLRRNGLVRRPCFREEAT